MLDAEYEARIITKNEKSPSLKRECLKSPPKTLYSDRFIPCRTSPTYHSSPPSLKNKINNNNVNNSPKESNPFTKYSEGPMCSYQMILRSEILGEKQNTETQEKKERLLRFQCRKQLDFSTSPYSLSPFSSYSQKLLKSPPKAPRKIAITPTRVLEAPAIKDDFYLNLIDWSSQNIVAVGLGSSVYLWNACTGQVSSLCDLGINDCVTSVNWISKGNHLAVGTHKGSVMQWDVCRNKLICELTGHKSRVGALAWHENVLSSGSRDRTVFNRDVRSGGSSSLVQKLAGHRQEVCGLKWSPDGQQLASGGNDNNLFIWDVNNTKALRRYTEHTAAVKAIAWSPHQRGLLASGGGTADRCLRFWNTCNNESLHCVDTGSQVCNVAWSKNVNELVTTHGYSQNQVIVWDYPSMSQIANLTGHTMRVLYLSVSPDGTTIVTGAGDETLRFWNIFPKITDKSSRSSSSIKRLRRTEIR